MRWLVYVRRLDRVTGKLPKRSSLEVIYQYHYEGSMPYQQVWKRFRKEYPWYHSSSIRIERDAF